MVLDTATLVALNIDCSIYDHISKIVGGNRLPEHSHMWRQAVLTGFKWDSCLWKIIKWLAEGGWGKHHSWIIKMRGVNFIIKNKWIKNSIKVFMFNTISSARCSSAMTVYLSGGIYGVMHDFPYTGLSFAWTFWVPLLNAARVVPGRKQWRGFFCAYVF